MAWSLTILGIISTMRGDSPTAQTQLEEAVELFKERQNQRGIAEALWALARALYMQKNYLRSRDLYYTTCQLYLTKSPHATRKWAFVASLRSLGEVSAMLGHPIRAAQLWGFAATFDVPVLPFESATYQAVEHTVRIQLGQKVFAKAWSEGRAP